ncbi:hypothetical protein ACWIGI_08725 [Nocardia sp. NPDC055321]
MYGNWGRRLLASAAAGLLCLGVAACGNTENADDSPQSGITTSAGLATPAEASPGQIGRPFTADPAIVNPHPLEFDSWTRLDGNKISVNFQTGAPECYGVDATVTETDKTVTVALRSGTRPDAVGKMCTMIMVFGSLEVELKSPVGDRTVLSVK